MGVAEAVRDIHITAYFPPVTGERMTVRSLGFIHVLLQEARPVNLSARNSICKTIHQRALHKPRATVR